MVPWFLDLYRPQIPWNRLRPLIDRVRAIWELLILVPLTRLSSRRKGVFPDADPNNYQIAQWKRDWSETVCVWNCQSGCVNVISSVYTCDFEWQPVTSSGLNICILTVCDFECASGILSVPVGCKGLQVRRMCACALCSTVTFPKNSMHSSCYISWNSVL